MAETARRLTSVARVALRPAIITLYGRHTAIKKVRTPVSHTLLGERGIAIKYTTYCRKEGLRDSDTREMSEIEVKAHSSERIREMRQLLGIAMKNVIILNEDATTMQ